MKMPSPPPPHCRAQFIVHNLDGVPQDRYPPPSPHPPDSPAPDSYHLQVRVPVVAIGHVGSGLEHLWNRG